MPQNLSSRESSSQSQVQPMAYHQNLLKKSLQSLLENQILKSIYAILRPSKNIKKRSENVQQHKQDQVQKFWTNCLFASIDRSRNSKNLSPFEIVTVGKY